MFNLHLNCSPISSLASTCKWQFASSLQSLLLPALLGSPHNPLEALLEPLDRLGLLDFVRVANP